MAGQERLKDRYSEPLKLSIERVTGLEAKLKVRVLALAAVEIASRPGGLRSAERFFRGLVLLEHQLSIQERGFRKEMERLHESVPVLLQQVLKDLRLFSTGAYSMAYHFPEFKPAIMLFLG